MFVEKPKVTGQQRIIDTDHWIVRKELCPYLEINKVEKIIKAIVQLGQVAHASSSFNLETSLTSQFIRNLIYPDILLQNIFLYLHIVYIYIYTTYLCK